MFIRAQRLYLPRLVGYRSEEIRSRYSGINDLIFQYERARVSFSKDSLVKRTIACNANRRHVYFEQYTLVALSRFNEVYCYYNLFTSLINFYRPLVINKGIIGFFSLFSCLTLQLNFYSLSQSKEYTIYFRQIKTSISKLFARSQTLTLANRLDEENFSIPPDIFRRGF